MDQEKIQKLLLKILNDLASEDIQESINELSVVFTDDSEIKELNNNFRGKDRATDVLSFSQIEGDDETFISTSLGDIVISLDTATAQSEELKVSFDDEIKRLLIHGVLHLFGYDHENVPQEEVLRMQKREDELFEL